jgi:hypothetical protein
MIFLMAIPPQWMVLHSIFAPWLLVQKKIDGPRRLVLQQDRMDGGGIAVLGLSAPLIF